MKWGRTMLLALTVGCGASAWWLGAEEPVQSPVPPWVTVFAIVGIAVSWAWQRYDPRGRPHWMWLPTLGAVALGGLSVFVAVLFRDVGYWSLGTALQILACLSFAGFVQVDRFLSHNEPTARFQHPGWAAVPAALCLLGLGVLLLAFNPVSAPAAAPTAEPQESLMLGDVTVSAHADSVSGTGPEGTWTYRHRGAQVSPWPKHSGRELITNPGGTYVAVSFVLPFSTPFRVTGVQWERPEPDFPLQHVVVLETATGQVVKEVSVPRFVNVQLTDSTVLIGQEAYSLAGGGRVWRSDAIPVSFPSRTALNGFFITDTRCARDEDWLTTCQLDLVHEGKPEEGATTLGGVVGHPNPRYPVIVDGWVLRRANPVEPIADEATGVDVGAELVAYYIPTGQEIPVGRAIGAEAVEGELAILPAITVEDADSWEQELGNNLPDPEAWFNPLTKQVRR
ncbi:MAG: hypothetical protein Q4D79_06185 [Propionibacteriaceae bacterium]|nr:hypothetical protein [Propionibacteriaceae bacterium]